MRSQVNEELHNDDVMLILKKTMKAFEFVCECFRGELRECVDVCYQLASENIRKSELINKRSAIKSCFDDN